MLARTVGQDARTTDLKFDVDWEVLEDSTGEKKHTCACLM